MCKYAFITRAFKYDYKQKRNYCKHIIRQAHEESWNRFISDIEADVHGRQMIAFKIMKTLNKEEKDQIMINSIEEEKWIKHYQDLWFGEGKKEDDVLLEEENTEGLDDISLEELTDAFQTTRNRKATGLDGINIELWKYGGIILHLRLLHLYNKCWKYNRVPEEWNTAKVISIFKKGNRKDCANYRGISLTDTAYKIYAKILNNRLSILMEHLITEEQMGFRKGRSTIDGVFILQQIIEKHR